MKLTGKAFLLSVALFCLNLCASGTPTFTLKGAVVTQDGTMVPEFTVIVRPIADKPTLVLRKRFTNGTFAIEGLMREKYQVQILSTLYVGYKMDVHFPAKGRATKQYRVVVLHRLRDGTNYLPEASKYSMSPKALRQHVPERARTAYERGVLLHNQGKLEQALTAYGEAIRNSPEYIPALIDVGTVYIGLNRPDSALTFLRRAYRVDQSNPIVRMKLAIALMAKRQYAEAAELLEKVYRVEPRKSVPLFYLASIQFYQKKYSEAEELLREALAEDPGMVDGWVLLVNMALEQEKYPAAREGLGHLRKAMNNEVFTRFVEDQLASLN